MIILTLISAAISLLLFRVALLWTVESLLPCRVEVRKVESASLGFNWLLQRRAIVWLSGIRSALPINMSYLPHRGDYSLVKVYRLGGLILRARVLRIESESRTGH